MKISHNTDTHLIPRGTDQHDLNPREHFETCIESIKALHVDAELCIINRRSKQFWRLGRLS